MRPLRVLCPAKINTFLAVGRVDTRGMHPLRTVFQAIDWCEELTLAPADETRLTSNWPDLPMENTLTKALRLAGEYFDIPALHIHLEKRIPHQSGLGGGSSDAAGLLRGLARLIGQPKAPFWNDVAQAVGADVPFFMVGGRARAEGYGEKLTPLPDPPSQALLVVQPPVTVPTGPAFAALDGLDYPWREFPEGGELYNDFERVAPCECGELAERMQVLGASGAMLTGSGSAVFGEFATHELAERALRALPSELVLHARVCRTLTRAESLAIEVME